MMIEYNPSPPELTLSQEFANEKYAEYQTACSDLKKIETFRDDTADFLRGIPKWIVNDERKADMLLPIIDREMEVRNQIEGLKEILEGMGYVI